MPKNEIRQCDLIVTEKCQLSCQMCHIWKHGHERRDDLVSLAEYRDFMRALKEFCPEGLQMQLVGGEPLMKPGIVDLIRLATAENFYTTMTTNGFLLDRGLADEILGSGLKTLGFSLESHIPERHDFLRGRPGVHKKIMEALAYFDTIKDFRLQVFIAAVITRVNLDDILGLADWANRQRRINFMYFQAVMQVFAMPESDTWYVEEGGSFLWPDADRAEKVLQELIKRKNSGYKINNHPGQLEVFKTYFRHPERFIKTTKCNLGYKSFTVLPDGNIFLCLSMEPIGNIKTDRIGEVWFAEKATRVRDQIAHCKRNCKLMVNCFFEEESDGA
jgi:MoaA/NifB/PqqE/SkfB family radical SAM enzyme